MYLKILEQQLKKNGWISNFPDPKMAKKLSEQTAEALNTDEKVFSITCANKIDQEGQPSASLWLLILTKKELFFVELDSDEDTWHSTPQHVNINDIRLVEKGISHLNPDLLRINIISSEKGFVFESIDSDSAFHFVDQANRLLKGDDEKMDETLNLTKSRDFQDLEAINTTTQTTHIKAQETKSEKSKKKPQNKDKDRKLFNYFFNFSSLFKSNPAMEVLFLAFELIWILCDIICIGMIDGGVSGSISHDSGIALGVLMLIFSLLAIGILIPYLINIWKVGTITNKAKIFILIEVMQFFFMVISSLLIANTYSSGIFPYVGLMFAIAIFTWVLAEFSRQLIEWKAKAKAEEKTVKEAK